MGENKRHTTAVDITKENSMDVSVLLKENMADATVTPHLHEEYEIYYNISGAKGCFINESYYECSAHDLFIIQKMHIHRTVIGDTHNYIRCSIHVGSDTINKISQLLPDKKVLDFFDKTESSLPVKVHLNTENHDKFMLYIKEHLRLEKSGDILLLLANFLELLSFIKVLFVSKKGEIISESVPQKWPEKAVCFIEKSFRNCQTGDVARALNINENYLSRVFKNETGVSLNNYIIQRRIAEAKKLLNNGATVRQACIDCGFNDCSNFIRTFKKFTGVSPGSIKKPVKKIKTPII